TSAGWRDAPEARNPDWKTSPSLQGYNGPVATRQANSGKTLELRPMREPLRVDPQVVEPLSQGIPVDTQELRGPELVAAGLMERMLEKRPLERRERAVV